MLTHKQIELLSAFAASLLQIKGPWTSEAFGDAMKRVEDAMAPKVDDRVVAELRQSRQPVPHEIEALLPPVAVATGTDAKVAELEKKIATSDKKLDAILAALSSNAAQKEAAA